MDHQAPEAIVGVLDKPCRVCGSYRDMKPAIYGDRCENCYAVDCNRLGMRGMPASEPRCTNHSGVVERGKVPPKRHF